MLGGKCYWRTWAVEIKTVFGIFVLIDVKKDIKKRTISPPSVQSEQGSHVSLPAAWQVAWELGIYIADACKASWAEHWQGWQWETLYRCDKRVQCTNEMPWKITLDSKVWNELLRQQFSLKTFSQPQKPSSMVNSKSSLDLVFCTEVLTSKCNAEICATSWVMAWK